VRARVRVEITASAERDVLAIVEYIEAEDPAASRRWLATIRRQIETLASVPRRGQVIPEAEDLGLEYRHLVHGRYRTIYRIEDHRVLIVRVIHSAQLLGTPE
jgi:plasmid stabilization system protein ParE